MKVSIVLLSILFFFSYSANGKIQDIDNEVKDSIQSQQVLEIPKKICLSHTECYKNFQTWKQTFAQNKWSPQQQIYRDYLFQKNAKKIEAHNSQPNLTFTMKVNKFAALSEEQFQHDMLITRRTQNTQDNSLKFMKRNAGRLLQTNSQWHQWFVPRYRVEKKSAQVLNSEQSFVSRIINPSPSNLDQSKLPRLLSAFEGIPNGGNGIDSIDWIYKGKVTSIKDQGRCASCWAFTTAAILETHQLKLNSNASPNYSEQQLVDCTKKSSGFGNYGCPGGWSYKAMNFVVQNGIASENQYPYTGNQDGSCSLNSGNFRVSKYEQVYGCTNLEKKLLKYPLTVGIDGRQLKYYNYGIMTQTQCAPNRNAKINHQVVFIAFNSQYWRAKNSWGKDWGEKGTIRLSKSGNPCAICDQKFIGIS